MKKNSKTKRRIDQVYAIVDVGEDRTLTVQYDGATDQIDILGAKTGSTRTERSYERSSGKPKIVSSTPSDGKSAFTAKRALFAYDYVVAVDTNTRSLFGQKCAVCVSYFTPTPPARCTSPGVPFICLAAYLIVGLRDGVNAEQIGWHLIISRHLRKEIPSGQKLAIVVDSEFQLHRDMNKRSKAYYMDHLLPPQMALVYSSSDVDNETLGGAMIRMCDAMSTKIFKQLRNVQLPPSKYPNDDSNYEGVYSLPVTRS
jgi:hypothetical protein